MQVCQFVDISVGRTVRCSTSSSVIPSELHYSTVLCSAAQWRSAICTGSVLQLVAVQCRCLRNHVWDRCTSLDNAGLHCIPKNNKGLNCFALNTALLCHPLNCTALHCIALQCTVLHYTALSALHCITLHCAICTALHCTALYITTMLCTLQCFTV